MTDREIDLLIAQKVFGLQTFTASLEKCAVHNGRLVYGKTWIVHGEWEGVEVPGVALPHNYTTDAYADLSVLHHIRQAWDEDKQEAFHHALFNIMHAKALDTYLYHEFAYDVGDYSRAALKALEENNE